MLCQNPKDYANTETITFLELQMGYVIFFQWRKGKEKRTKQVQEVKKMKK